MRIEILHLPPAARALLLGLMIAVSGVWVLTDYAGGPTGLDGSGTQIEAEGEEGAGPADDGFDVPLDQEEGASREHRTTMETPATQQEDSCQGTPADEGFSFTYWVIDDVVFVLADPVASGHGEDAIYEWDWGDGTLSYGGVFMSHHYMVKEQRYDVTVARLAPDGEVTHSSTKCIEPDEYLVHKLMDRAQLSLPGERDVGPSDAPQELEEDSDPVAAERVQTQAVPQHDEDPSSAEGDADDSVHWQTWFPGALTGVVLVFVVVAVRVHRR